MDDVEDKFAVGRRTRGRQLIRAPRLEDRWAVLIAQDLIESHAMRQHGCLVAALALHPGHRVG